MSIKRLRSPAGSGASALSPGQGVLCRPRSGAALSAHPRYQSVGCGGIPVRAGLGDRRHRRVARRVAAAARTGSARPRCWMRPAATPAGSTAPISACAMSASISCPHLIAGLQARAAAGDVRGEYHLADITGDALPRCDAILCRDCLVHLSFANIARAVANFARSGAAWLITTTFPEWQANRRLRGRRLARAEFRARAV